VRHGLWVDVRSKAERGRLLAAGEAQAAPRQARRPLLATGMTPAQAWRAVVRACSEQIVVNASQIASGTHAAEHVHQLRVGLRRLRSALRLFAAAEDLPALFDPALGDAATELFRRLGAVRDQDVLQGPLAAALDAALVAAGLDGGAATVLPVADAAAACAAVRAGASQQLVLDLIASSPIASAAGTAARHATPRATANSTTPAATRCASASSGCATRSSSRPRCSTTAGCAATCSRCARCRTGWARSTTR
jgi:inorganic triphosphatase YgiF